MGEYKFHKNQLTVGSMIIMDGVVNDNWGAEIERGGGVLDDDTCANFITGDGSASQVTGM